ncbi:MAG: hypothetical protein U0470_10935 [Anaerolineae bacterium]
MRGADVGEHGRQRDLLRPSVAGDRPGGIERLGRPGVVAGAQAGDRRVRRSEGGQPIGQRRRRQGAFGGADGKLEPGLGQGHRASLLVVDCVAARRRRPPSVTGFVGAYLSRDRRPAADYPTLAAARPGRLDRGGWRAR